MSKNCTRTPLVRTRLLRILSIVVASALAAQGASRPLSAQDADYDQRLKGMGETLSQVSAPVGIYKRVVIVGNMAYLSGHIPISADGRVMVGKLGDGVSIEQGQLAARRSGLAMLASLKAELGTLNRIKRLVKTTGMVNCTDDFTDQPSVINGCSQLFKDLFGEENGVGARSAVGMSSLPRGAIVEIEAIFELTDE